MLFSVHNLKPRKNVKSHLLKKSIALIVATLLTCSLVPSVALASVSTSASTNAADVAGAADVAILPAAYAAASELKAPETTALANEPATSQEPGIDSQTPEPSPLNESPNTPLPPELSDDLPQSQDRTELAKPDEPTESTEPENSDPEEITPQQLPPVATPLAAGTYYIRPACSLTRMLDIAGGSQASGAKLQLYRSNKTAAQQFTLTYDELGYYTIINASGNALDVTGGKAQSATPVWQYRQNGTLAQRWIIRGNTENGFELVSALSPSVADPTLTVANATLSLDVAGAANSDGAKLQIYRSNGSAAQRFNFLSTTYSHKGQRSIEDGIYRIVPQVNTGFALDIPGASQNNSVQLQTYPSNNTFAQMFQITWQNDSYNIAPLNSMKALDVAGGSIVAGAAVQQYQPNGSSAQAWQIEVKNPGNEPLVSFYASASGLVLDVAGASSAQGAKLQLYKPNGTAAQNFSLKKITASFSNGLYAFTPRANPSMRLDITGASYAAGAQAQAYQANSTAAQAFELFTISGHYVFRAAHSGMLLAEDVGSRNVLQRPGSLNAPVANQLWDISLAAGGYRISNLATGHVLALSGSRIVAAEPFAASYPPEQRFDVRLTTIVASGAYRIVTPSGNYLDVTNSSLETGSKIKLASSSTASSQKFIFQQAGSGVHTIKAAPSGKMLDVQNGSSANGASLQIYPANNTKAQNWQLLPSGDGWFVLRSLLGTWLAATSDASNASIQTTTEPADALRLHLEASSYNTGQHSPTYFSQHNGFWASSRYGFWNISQSGCSPCAIAMALSGYLNRTVYPTEVASWLYNNTGEFNKSGAGASGLAIALAIRAFGLNANPIGSQAGLSEALARGNIVVMYVGPGTFIRPGATHALCLHANSNGNTYVYDSNNAGLNGWYTISSIWSQRSRDPYDNRGGYIAYELYW